MHLAIAVGNSKRGPVELRAYAQPLVMAGEVCQEQRLGPDLILFVVGCVSDFGGLSCWCVSTQLACLCLKISLRIYVVKKRTNNNGYPHQVLRASPINFSVEFSTLSTATVESRTRRLACGRT